MNKGLKIGLAVGGGVLGILGIRYAYTRKRLVDNIKYRPELNLQRSAMYADKLVLSMDLIINNPTPNSITITKPTLTLRYSDNGTDTEFTAIPSSESFTIGTGQTIIPDIKVEIVYSDTLSVGKSIIDKLLKCQPAVFKADVAMTVDKWVFLAQKDVKEITISRDSIPSKLSKFLPACGSKAAGLVNDVLQLVNIPSDTPTVPLTGLGSVHPQIYQKRYRTYAGRR